MTDLFDSALERQRRQIIEDMAKAPREAKPAWRRTLQAHVTKMLEEETAAHIQVEGA